MMKELQLSPRLSAIAELIPDGARLADIGTDHAYLPIALLQRGRIASAIACDLREGPLARGQEAARDWHVDDITFRRCDGLKGLSPDEANCIVIAGMGGETILKILAAAPWTKEPGHGLHFLLQPMSGLPELREWLTEMGYRIEREVIVPEEGRFYVILSVRPGRDTPYTYAERMAGRQWERMESPWRTAYLEDLVRRWRRAVAGMQQGVSIPETRVEDARVLLEKLEALQKEWLSWQE